MRWLRNILSIQRVTLPIHSVILSDEKDLFKKSGEILRFAQDDIQLGNLAYQVPTIQSSTAVGLLFVNVIVHFTKAPSQ